MLEDNIARLAYRVILAKVLHHDGSRVATLHHAGQC